MDSTPILVFLDWNKEFHVHVDASSVSLGVVLAYPGEGYLEKLYNNREGRYINGICIT